MQRHRQKAEGRDYRANGASKGELRQPGQVDQVHRVHVTDAGHGWAALRGNRQQGGESPLETEPLGVQGRCVS
jgi:hypothetical protein